MKTFIQSLALRAGYTLRRRVAVPQGIPNRELYDPFFQPWYGADFQRLYGSIRAYSLVSPESAYVLWALARQAADHAEKMAALINGQGRCRLVENDELQLMRQALGEKGVSWLERDTRPQPCDPPITKP